MLHNADFMTETFIVTANAHFGFKIIFSLQKLRFTVPIYTFLDTVLYYLLLLAQDPIHH